jgi:hypothetical protein
MRRTVLIGVLVLVLGAMATPPAALADHQVRLEITSTMNLVVVQDKPKFRLLVTTTASATHPCVMYVGWQDARVTKADGTVTGPAFVSVDGSPGPPASFTTSFTSRQEVVLDPGDRLSAQGRVECHFQQPVGFGHYLVHVADAPLAAEAPGSIDGQAKPLLADAQKQEYRRAAKTFSRMAYVSGSSGFALALIPCGGCQVLGTGFGAMAIVFEGTGQILDLIAEDPADFAFQSLAPVRRLTVPKIDRLGGLGLNRGVKRSIRALIQAQLDAQVRLRAMLTSIERAQGAGLVSATDWEAAHVKAAVAHAEMAASMLERMANLQRQLARLLRAQGIGTRRPTRAAYRRLQRSLRAGKAPAQIVQALREWRLSPSRRDRIRELVLAVPARRLQTPVSLLGDRELLGTLRSSAETLRTLAAQLRQGAIPPR